MYQKPSKLADMLRTVFTVALAGFLSSAFSQSLTGHWRGEFELRPDLAVPFNFEISKVPGSETKLFFLNAEERFEGGLLKQKGDSVFVALDQFENELAFAITGKTLTGILRKQDGSGKGLPVKASIASYRFKEPATEPAGDISGTYDVVFKQPGGKEEKAVGLFKQEGKKLRGTFLRVTGDSRYLDGIVEGNKFYLSSFIGSSPAYYTGSFTADGQLTGEIVGTRGSMAFTATANEDAALPDPYHLTLLKDGYSSLDFSLPDADGKTISLKDKKYQGKVVIVTIAGTWCPNCIDEALFLSPWYKANKKRGVEVIAIHYERKTDPAYVKKALDRFRSKYDIGYDQVFGGVADKQAVAASLPALNTFLSFPTTILIGKNGKVAKIHTGYSGPATGKYYTEFVTEFNKDIDELLK